MSRPPRLTLARTPTPFEPLTRAGARLGVELWIKRDDATGGELSGNKIRKLEFLLADAKAKGADTVLTCGGVQSNHARATAFACARLGLRSRLYLRTATPATPPTVAAEGGNLLLDQLAGAEVVFISPDDYRRRTEVLAAAARELDAQGRRAYVVPEGGSNALGSWGYVAAVEELAADLARAKLDGPTTVIYACGSGGTGAGLIMGAARHAPHLRVVGVNVCDDAAYFQGFIGGLLADAARDYGLQPGPVEILDGFVGRGYAQSRPEELRELALLAREEGVVLDPVYTGKAWYGLSETLRRDPAAFGQRIVFVHTGGLFGVFPKAADFAAALTA